MKPVRHLVKNALGHYYVRIYVPKDLRDLIRKNELRKSMQTTCEATAATRSTFWIIAIKEYFKHLRDQHNMTFANDPWALGKGMLIAKDYKRKVVKDGTRVSVEFEASEIQVDGPEDLEALSKLIGEDAANKIIGNIKEEEDTKSRARMNVAAAVRDPEAVLNSSEQKLSTYLDVFEKRRLGNGEKLAESTTRNYRNVVALFIEIFGDLPVDLYTEENAVDFRDTLRLLPQKVRYNLPWKTMSIAEILECDEVGKKLQSGTIKDYLTRISSIFRDLNERNTIKFNIFKDVKIAVTRKNKYLPYKQVELQTIFAADNLVIDREHPSHFWLPIIALYTGMRRSEIFFLRAEDIQVENDIEYIDINTDGVKGTKTDSSPRKIPIHNKLIDLGFLTYVQQVQDRDGAAARLFPEYSDSRGQAGHKFSDWFIGHRKFLEINEPGRVFHSFRSNFINELERHNGNTYCIQRLAGHSLHHSITHDPETGYGGKRSVTELKTEIDKIDFSNATQEMTRWPFL